MSTPSEPTKPSTTAADNVGKEQHDFPKSGTVEQDTAIHDTLQGSLDAKIVIEDHPAASSDGASSTANVVTRADLLVPETLASPRGAEDSEVWIPKGPESGGRPTGTPSTTPRPQKPPSKPKRDN